MRDLALYHRAKHIDNCGELQRSAFAATMRYMHLSRSARDEGIAMLVRSRDEGGRSVAVGATPGETLDGQRARK
jgi:hypothetical protein